MIDETEHDENEMSGAGEISGIRLGVWGVGID